MAKIWKIGAGWLVCAAGLAFNLLSFDSFLFFGLPLIAGVAVAAWNTMGKPGYRTIDQVTDLLRIYMGGHLFYSSFRYWSTDMQASDGSSAGWPIH